MEQWRQDLPVSLLHRWYTGGIETDKEYDRVEHYRCTKNNERQDNYIILSSVILMVMMIW